MTRERRKENDIIDSKEDVLLRGLIRRSRKGDTGAMEALYERFSHSLFNLIYRHVYNVEIAEDLLQDVFLRVFTRLQQLKSEETFVGWLYRVAINTCYSYLRGKRSQAQRIVPWTNVDNMVGEAPCESEFGLSKIKLDEAVMNLPFKQKTVFLLHDVQGFKHNEIAAMLACTQGTSKSQLFKARMKLRAYLKEKKAL